MDKIEKQLEEFSKSHSQYVLYCKKDFVLKGILIVNASYNNITLYDEYEVKIKINKDYPNTIPKVYELSKKIPDSYKHINVDSSLCLGTDLDIYDCLNNCSSFEDFYNSIICVVFYGISFLKRYGYCPFGERSHGNKGIVETYKEKFGIKDEEELLKIAQIYVNKSHHKIICYDALYYKYKKIEDYYLFCRIKPYQIDFEKLYNKTYE